MNKTTLEILTYAFSTGVFALAIWYWVRQYESMLDLLRMAAGG
jgi:hypothetical protein